MLLVGLVLAAGAGTRFGGPKGLARADDGLPWVEIAVRMLRDAGCDAVLVVVGARADEVAALVPDDARVVVAPDWAEGMGASLRAGLGAAVGRGADAVVITPVDTPEAPAAAVRRLLDAVGGDLEGAVAQAVYSPAPAASGASPAGASPAGPAASGHPTEPHAAPGRRHPGHPVVIGRDHLAAVIATLSGDRGARRYLVEHGVREVDCSDLWSGDDRDRR